MRIDKPQLGEDSMTPLIKRSLRIAYIDTGGTNYWTGGLTYRQNLFEAMRQYAPQVEVYLLTQQNLENAEENTNFKVIKYPPSNDWLSCLINRVTLSMIGYDFLLRKAIRAIPNGGVDLIFPGRFIVGRQVAVLNWIPDFQFVHLPEMYTKARLIELDTKFRQGIKRATLVVLSSRDAQKDFCKFAPQFTHKARVVSFVARVPPLLYDTDPEAVVLQYHLPKKFFYLPNQFWKHKNHAIVLEALLILKSRNITPFIVFTGNPVDSRNPTYFAELMQKISLWGLRDQVAFLGLVPHDHVYLLMRQSISILNPSLFEGWSTTVEEAKSVGKRLVLSDLAVHREQKPPKTEYFDPHNAEDLVNKLEEIWVNVPPGPDLELESKAREAFPARMKNFADTFLGIASEAVGIVRGESLPYTLAALE